MRTHAPLLVAALLVTATCGAANLARSGAVTDALATPARADSKVGALGRIEPESENINLHAPSPDRLDDLTVRRGDPVSKGQILGHLDSYAEREAQEKLVAARLDEAKAQLAAQTELDNRRIEEAQERLKRVNEVTPMQIAAQSATIEAQQAVLDNNKNILASYTELLRTDAGSRRNRDNQRTVVQEEGAKLQAAQAQLKVLQQQFAIDQQLAETQVRLAEAALESTRASAPIRSLTQRLELARVQLRRSALISPIDGRVLNIQAHPGEQVGAPDDKPILSLGTTARMRVVAEVYETDITRVRIGDKATITSRALGAPLTGKVVEIGNMIFKNDILNLDPAARADARVVEVRIALDKSQPVAGLTNLTVDVVIDAAERKASADAPAK